MMRGRSSLGRRRALQSVLAGAVAIPALLLAPRTRADDEFPLLKEEDTSAKSIGYVADAAKVDPRQYPAFRQGQDCSNCKLYLGDQGDPKGPCELVLGQLVLAKAWCKAWEPKP